MTPHAWLLRLRLETALKLIQTRAGISMTELAYAVGFFDQSHFTRRFRTAYVTTPARFQQMNRNFLQASFGHASVACWDRLSVPEGYEPRHSCPNMFSFLDDYSEGANPDILHALTA